MSDKEIMPAWDADDAVAYTIKIKGYLEEHWSDWLGGFEISHDAQGHSLLTGDVPDQAALHGILAQIRDLGLTLISIIPQDNCVGEQEVEDG
jgi:hypothetical protein